jgi:DNA-binding response OmpR family regulator
MKVMDKIIVQDNDKSVLDVLTLALEMEGFQVCAMQSCDDNILSMIEEMRPHIVMLDFRISGEDCIAICTKIKAKYPHLPVLAISCNTNIQEQYSQFGFDGYIEKPFDLDLLYRILRSHIPNRDEVSTES